MGKGIREGRKEGNGEREGVRRKKERVREKEVRTKGGRGGKEMKDRKKVRWCIKENL